MIGWQTKRLGEVCVVNPPKNNNKLPKEVGFLTMADVSQNAQILQWQTRKVENVKSGFSFFANGDVLLAKITPCFENGKGALVKEAVNGVGFGSTEFHVLRVNPLYLLNKYLYYFVNNSRFRDENARFMTGSAGQQRITRDFLKNIKIPFPPIPVQEDIVNRLDYITKAQKLNDNLIQKTNELFHSLLHTELDPIKKGWEVKKIEEIARLHMGGTPSTAVHEYYENGSINWMKSGDVKGDFITSVSGKITEQGLKNSSAKIYPINSVVIALNGQGKTRGTSAILKIETASNQSVAAFTDFDNILEPEILYYQLKKRYLEIRRITGNNARSGLNLGILRDLKVLVPSKREQTNIVSKLSTVQSLGEQLFKQKQKLTELFNVALSRAFTGELIKEEVPAPVKIGKFPVWQAMGAVLQRFERGEMVLAKVLYIAQEIYKVPLGFRFAAQNFGPYDTEIKRTLMAGMSTYNRFFTRKNSGVYALGANAGKLFKYKSKALGSMEAVLKDLLPYIKNADSSAIECLATVCKIMQDNKTTDLAVIEQKMREWKQDRFSSQMIKGVYDFVVSKGWDQKLI